LLAVVNAGKHVAMYQIVFVLYISLSAILFTALISHLMAKNFHE